jgi:predicted amidohydrolase
VDVVYRKTWLGAGESARFSPGQGAAAIELDGWRLDLGICKDNGMPEYRAQIASLGVDAYVTGVLHRPPMQEEWGLAIARQCQTYVVFASFAGPTGSGYQTTAGTSTIWSPTGAVLARASIPADT